MSHLEVLEAELRKFPINLPNDQRLTLARYCDELARWNKKINLTGLTGTEMVRRLVVEPVWIGLQLKMRGALVDIGSGNGSPAIPLRVSCQLDECHLVEARTKRAAFLRHVTATLKLPNAVVHRSRFEDAIRELKRVDWITLQGVALTAALLAQIKTIAASTTTIVWISAPGVNTDIKPLKTLKVPLTGTEVFLFQLDLS